MRPIPIKMRRAIADDPWMKTCIWTGKTSGITWEHPWIYSGRQINEIWAIVPLHKDLNTNIMPQRVKEYCRWVSLMRAKPSDLNKYPKKDWNQERKRLNQMFLCQNKTS